MTEPSPHWTQVARERGEVLSAFISSQIAAQAAESVERNRALFGDGTAEPQPIDQAVQDWAAHIGGNADIENPLQKHLRETFAETQRQADDGAAVAATPSNPAITEALAIVARTPIPTSRQTVYGTAAERAAAQRSN